MHDLIRFLFLMGTLGLTLWLGMVFRHDLWGTFPIILLAVFLIGILIYGMGFVAWHLPDVFQSEALIENLVISVDIAKLACSDICFNIFMEALKDSLPAIDNKLFRSGLKAISDGREENTIASLINTKKKQLNQLDTQWLAQWRSLAHLSLALGIVLSVWQLIQLEKIAIGAELFYPVLWGGIIWMILYAFSYRLKYLIEERSCQRELVLDAVLAIKRQEQGEQLEERLFCYIPKVLLKHYQELMVEFESATSKETTEENNKPKDPGIIFLKDYLRNRK